jgi:hypothetical protein
LYWVNRKPSEGRPTAITNVSPHPIVVFARSVGEKPEPEPTGYVVPPNGSLAFVDGRREIDETMVLGTAQCEEVLKFTPPQVLFDQELFQGVVEHVDLAKLFRETSIGLGMPRPMPSPEPLPDPGPDPDPDPNPIGQVCGVKPGAESYGYRYNQSCCFIKNKDARESCIKELARKSIIVTCSTG